LACENQQLDTWVSEPAGGHVQPEEDSSMDAIRLSHDTQLDSPTPLAGPSNLASDSYFPPISQIFDATQIEDVAMDSFLPTTPTLANSPTSSTARRVGVKRKIGETSTVVSRPPSAKRDPSTPSIGAGAGAGGADTCTSWFSRPKPKKAPSQTSATAFGHGEGDVGAATPRTFGLPMIDASDRPTVLIVDDNADMRLWISSILQTDYSVVEARNGREALDLLQTLTPDLVRRSVLSSFLFARLFTC
jgi:CheY-like chemotaxis protein